MPLPERPAEFSSTRPRITLSPPVTSSQRPNHPVCAGLPCDPAEETASRLRNQDLAEPVCPPGTAFSYSNLGYALVGRVIEAVVGMPWREAVDAILLRPLGIDPVFVGDALSVSGHTAAGQPVGQLLAPILEPVGGLALSAADLAAFGRVHLGKPGLLDVVTASEMHTPVPVAEPVGLADGWGLGLAIFGGDGVDWLGHDGTADGTSCHLRIDQAGACVIALTANSVNGTALWRELIDELRLRGVPITRYRACPEQASRIDLPARYHGTYRNGAAEYTVTSDERGVPCLVADGEVFRDLTLYEGGAFTLAEPGTGEPADAGRFMRDAVLAGGRLARRA